MEFVRAALNHNRFRTRYFSNTYLDLYFYNILLGDYGCHAFTMTVHYYEHCPVGKE
jgi:hypothetical protein